MQNLPYANFLLKQSLPYANPTLGKDHFMQTTAPPSPPVPSCPTICKPHFMQTTELPSPPVSSRSTLSQPYFYANPAYLMQTTKSWLLPKEGVTRLLQAALRLASLVVHVHHAFFRPETKNTRHDPQTKKTFFFTNYLAKFGKGDVAGREPEGGVRGGRSVEGRGR